MSEEIFPPMTGEGWNEDPPEAWIFNGESELEEFLVHIRSITLDTINKYNYNSVPSFSSFYKAYKSSGVASLEEFYNDHYDVDFSLSYLSCVGLSFVFKEVLLYELEPSKYSELRNHIYFVQCCEFPNEAAPAAIQQGEPLCPPELTEHVSVVLKFHLDSRTGHVIMDFGFGITIPVVVMEDGKFPQTQPFQRISRLGIQTNTFKHVTSDYVRWSTHPPAKNPDRWFYLKRAFQRLDYPEKRHKVNSLQAAVRHTDGLLKAGYFVNLKTAPGMLTAFVNKIGTFETVKLQFEDVFVNGRATNQVLNSCLSVLGSDRNAELLELIEACLDEEFVSQLVGMDERLREMLYSKWRSGRRMVLARRIFKSAS